MNPHTMAIVAAVASLFTSAGIIVLGVGGLFLWNQLKRTDGHQLAVSVAQLKSEIVRARSPIPRMEMEIRHIQAALRHEHDDNDAKYRDIRDLVDNLIGIVSQLRDKLDAKPTLTPIERSD